MKVRRSALCLNIRVLIEYVLVFFVIMDGNTVYNASAEYNFHFRILCLVLSIILVIYTLVHSKLKKSALVMSIALFLYFGVYFIFQYENCYQEAYSCLYIIGIPLLLLYFTMAYKGNDVNSLFYKLEKVVLFISVLSLILWLLCCVLKLFVTNSFMIVNWGQTKRIDGYFGLQFITQIDNTYLSGLVRNTSFFCEAPMFNLWLDIALAVELFLKSQSSKIKIVILTITIVTTTSTTGVIFIVLCVALRYYLIYESTKYKYRILLTIVMLFFAPFLISIIQAVIGLKGQTSSYLIRMQDYVAGFQVWLQNPIFGSGFGNTASLYGYVYESLAGNVGFSNYITALLSTGGIWNFICYALGIIIPCFRRKKQTHLNVTCFIICYAFLTVTTSFYMRYIAAIFIAYGLSYLCAGKIIDRSMV